MLKRVNARVNIEIKQGDANEPFSVILSAVPIQNLSSEIEYSQDSKIAINMSESKEDQPSDMPRKRGTEKPASSTLVCAVGWKHITEKVLYRFGRTDSGL